MRLIDADAVLAALGIFHRHDNDEDSISHFMNGIETAIEIIEDAPDVKAVPLKPLAKWLAGQYVAQGFTLPVNFFPESGSRVYATNTECWERILREVDWGEDE